MIGWLAYALATALLAGLGAAAAERVLRAGGRPGRVAWLAAPLVSVALPVAALAGWRGMGRGASDAAVGVLVTAGPQSAGAGAAAARLFVVLWAVLSILALLFLFIQTLSLKRRSRSWRPARIGGVQVLVSREVGPAVLGLFRPAIVVPQWLFDVEGRFRRLAVLHEQEHCRAGDVALLNGMALLVALVPWNPALWWQAVRLNRAVELDCDERVMRRVGDRQAYGRMLLEAAARTAYRPRLAAGLGRRRSLLERRIGTLLATPARRQPMVAAGLIPVIAVVAAALPAPYSPAREGTRAQSRYRLVEDSLLVVRATAAGRPTRTDSTGTAIYEMREGAADGARSVEAAPAGVLRRADPDDPRIRELERRRPDAASGTVRSLREIGPGGAS